MPGLLPGRVGTEAHLAVDGGGTPQAATVTPGQAHESGSAELTLEAVRMPSRKRGRPRTRLCRLAGGEGCSHARIRRYPRGRGIVAVIPTRKGQRADPKFDRERYEQRDVIERCMGWLKESRRVGTRQENLAVKLPGDDPSMLKHP